MVKKILIIDDSPIARRILKKCIPDNFCHDIFEAEDGNEGLKKYKKIKPDLTFLDLTMPVMDGEQCLEEIIKFDKDARVIVVTANIQIEVTKKVKNLGALTIIKKGLDKKTFQEVLLNIMDL